LPLGGQLCLSGLTSSPVFADFIPPSPYLITKTAVIRSDHRLRADKRPLIKSPPLMGALPRHNSIASCYRFMRANIVCQACAFGSGKYVWKLELPGNTFPSWRLGTRKEGVGSGWHELGNGGRARSPLKIFQRLNDPIQFILAQTRMVRQSDDLPGDLFDVGQMHL